MGSRGVDGGAGSAGERILNTKKTKLDAEGGIVLFEGLWRISRAKRFSQAPEQNEWKGIEALFGDGKIKICDTFSANHND